jgi:hypothetical protein
MKNLHNSLADTKKDNYHFRKTKSINNLHL